MVSRPIRVLMLSRSTLYSAPGGDTVQIEATAKYLRELGVVVEIKKADSDSISYDDYDLLHLFNVIRPSDLLYHVVKSGKPYVLSTIYVDYSEFEHKSRSGLKGTIFKVLDKFGIEYVKTIARAVINKERIMSPGYLWHGHRRSMEHLLNGASCLLPNSHSELRRLKLDFNIKVPYQVVPNAIDLEKFGNVGLASERSGVICVARIEGLKNQLNLIKAMQGLDLTLTIIGKAAPNHQDYYQACKAAAGSNVFFIDHMPQEELTRFYETAKVHVLPSWFETTGLVSLEAGYSGCNIVVTRKGDTEEYFQDDAAYCNPDDIDSIRQAILQAYHRPASTNLKTRIAQHFNWTVTAQTTLAAYQQVVL